jgi:hypothetical protein
VAALALLSWGCAEPDPAPAPVQASDANPFAGMPYARNDPRAQLPAELRRVRSGGGSVRALSARLPADDGTTGIRVPPSREDGPTGRAPVGIVPGGGLLTMSEKSAAGLAAEARRELAGTDGPLDGVLPPDAAADARGGTSERSDAVTFNGDDRTRVQPFTSKWGQAVRLLLIFANGARGECSGTIVPNGWILTAGHCLYDREEGLGAATGVVAVPALDGVYMPYGAYEADLSAGLWVGGDWHSSGKWWDDWGLVKTRVEFEMGPGAATVYAASDSELDLTTFRARGYPGELGPSTSSILSDPRAGNFMYQADGSLLVPRLNFGSECQEFVGYDPNFLCTESDMTKGHSGAGAYLTYTGARKVYAIASHDGEYLSDDDPFDIWRSENVYMRVRSNQVGWIASVTGVWDSQTNATPPPVGYSANGLAALQEPTIVSDGYSVMTALAVGPGGAVRATHRSTTGWSTTPDYRGGIFTTPVRAVSEGVGRLDYYGVGQDGNLWGETRVSGAWSGQSNRGRPSTALITEQPALSPIPGWIGHDLAVTDANGHVWTRRSTTWGGVPSAGSWVRVTPFYSGEAAGPPAINTRSSTVVDVIYRTKGNAVRHRVVNYAATSTCTAPPCVSFVADVETGAASQPTSLNVTAGPAGQTELLIGENGPVGTLIRHYSYTPGGGWAGPNPLGGGWSRHQPAGVYRPSSGRFDVFLTGMDGSLWQIARYSSGAWSSQFPSHPAQPRGRIIHWFIGAPAVAASRDGSVLSVAHRWVPDAHGFLVTASQNASGGWLSF